MLNFCEFITSNSLGTYTLNESFKDLTTIGCGGHISVVYYPETIEALTKAYQYLNESDIKHFIVGNGSNLLASDRDFLGVVICLKKLPYDFFVTDDYISVSAFYPSSKFAYDLAAKELGDFSFLGGIPGLIGGAISSNSGAYNEEIGKYVIEVDYLDTNGEVRTMKQDECLFSYRKSIFHSLLGVILRVRLKYHKINTEMMLSDRKKRRQLSQPLNVKSMGSIFKNNPLIPSWEIIDALNLRGFKIGDAAVSCKHTNFIINLGEAKTNDVLALIELIITRARLELGIELLCEIKILV